MLCCLILGHESLTIIPINLLRIFLESAPVKQVIQWISPYIIIRDRESNMSNIVNNLRLKLEAQGKARRSFGFYMPNSFE